MPFAHINFTPRSLASALQLGEAVDWYAACLWKNGQTGINYQVGLVGSSWRLSAHLWGNGAHRSASHADYGRKALAAACKLARNRPAWRLAQGGPDNDGFAIWRDAPSLYVRAPTILAASESGCPLLRGDNGSPVPIYKIPVSGNLREQLATRLDLLEQLFMVWLQSGELEIHAYRALADVHRERMGWLREYIAAIELATGLPTYLQLARYYGHRTDNEELNRPCPGCGKRWSQENWDDGPGLAGFCFRCDRCRLVQHAKPPTGDPVRLARIGDWKPGPCIASAAVLLKKVKSKKHMQ